MKVGNRWRFLPEALADWFQHKPAGAAPRARSSRHHAAFSVAALMRPEAIVFGVTASGMRPALEQITSRLAAANVVREPARFLEVLLEREELMSTVLADFVAVPHPRRSIAGMFPESLIAVALAPAGVDFDGPGAAPVKVFFVICASDDRTHLQILARLSRFLKDTDLIEALSKAHEPSEVIDLLARAERRLHPDAPGAAS